MEEDKPKFVNTLLARGALLVGISAEGDADSDWDILVPHEYWRAIAPMVPDDATPNKFGGWRFEKEGEFYDIWPDSLHRFLKEATLFKGNSSVKITGKHYSLEAKIVL